MIFRKSKLKVKPKRIIFPNQHNGIFGKLCKKLESKFGNHCKSYDNLLEAYIIHNVQYEKFTLSDDKYINWPNMAFGSTKRSNCVDNAYIAHSFGRYINSLGWIMAYGGYDDFNPISHLEHFIYVFYDFDSNNKPGMSNLPICLWNKFDETKGNIVNRYPSLEYILLNLNDIVNNTIYGNAGYLSINNVKEPLIVYLTPLDIEVLNNCFNSPGMKHISLFNMMPDFSKEYYNYLQRKKHRFDEVVRMAKRSKLTEAAIKANDDKIFAKIKKLYQDDYEETLKYLNEEDMSFDETNKNDIGYVINKSAEEGIKRFGSYEAYLEHVDQRRQKYEELIAQTSYGEAYFNRQKRLLESLQNDPTVHPENFIFVDGKAVRINK